MGKSHTYKYQIGRSYTIKDVIYDAVFSSTNKSDAVIRSKQYNDALIKKDLGAFVVLIPVSPSMTTETPRFTMLLKKYRENYKKSRGV
jgi:hypothetical protein